MKRNRSFVARVIGLLLVAGFAVFLAEAPSANACSTPVYRYAMYRWFPAPYTVFYFHKSEPNEADVKLHEAIEAYADYDQEEPANIDLVRMDLNKDPELKRLPPFLRKAWEKDNDGSLPAYMLVSPLGDNMHRGKLDLAELKSMVKSSARDQIVKMLAEGRTCVYVMLTCSDKAKNAAAEAAAQKAIKVVASGDVEFYDGELPYFDQLDEEDDDAKEGEEKQEEKKASKHSIGWLKVDRQNETERWLVRSLLTVEYDLAEIDEPMVFAVFGRGRALPPYLGKGVTEDNLLDYFAEVTGACSCTVKDQNPGMDLLIKNDWDAVAEAMAQRYSSDEGAEGTISDLFPQLIVPGGDVDKPQDETKDETKDEPAGDEPAKDEPAGDQPQKDDATADEPKEAAAPAASSSEDE